MNKIQKGYLWHAHNTWWEWDIQNSFIETIVQWNFIIAIAQAYINEWRKAKTLLRINALARTLEDMIKYIRHKQADALAIWRIEDFIIKLKLWIMKDE